MKGTQVAHLAGESGDKHHLAVVVGVVVLAIVLANGHSSGVVDERHERDLEGQLEHYQLVLRHRSIAHVVEAEIHLECISLVRRGVASAGLLSPLELYHMSE